MNEENIIKLSTNLRQSLYKEWLKFFKKNKMSCDDAFFINSVVISSLISQVVYSMFKKEVVTISREQYIDEICEFSKIQLKDGLQMIKDNLK